MNRKELFMKRVFFTNEERTILEKYFSENKTSTSVQKMLAQKFNSNPTKIKRWFEDRKFKNKEQTIKFKNKLILNDFYEKNNNPSEQDLIMLKKQTNMSMDKLIQWFVDKNYRKRKNEKIINHDINLNKEKVVEAESNLIFHDDWNYLSNEQKIQNVLELFK